MTMQNEKLKMQNGKAARLCSFLIFDF